jgi:hypothetical protein
MSLTVRERRVLADIERALAQEDPRLARQLVRMLPAPPPDEKVPLHWPSESRANDSPEEKPAVTRSVWDPEPGTRARRFARWCAALSLVLLVVAGLTASTGVLLGAGATALACGAACMMARSAAVRRE